MPAARLIIEQAPGVVAMQHFVARIALALSVSFLLGACADVGSRVRRYTYPPELTYVPPDRLDLAMWRLAEQIRWLDVTLRDETRPEPDRQRIVIDLLDKIHGESLALQTDAAITSHPLLDRHLPRLRDDVALARAAAAATPPRYALAGAVTGACIYRHESRVAPTQPAQR